MTLARVLQSVATVGIAAMAIGLAAVPAPAQVGFYLTSPGIPLSEADREQLRQAIGGALNEAEIDEVRSWQNAETGVGGDVKVLERSMVDETSCAQTEIVLRNASRQRTFELLFCQRPDGTWGIAG